MLFFKPVLVAGFSFVVAASLAQDYIDVEAERQAARRARELDRAANQPPAPITPSAGLVVEQAGSVPATGGAAVPSTSTAGYGGIRPYSGTTRVVVPTDSMPEPLAASSAPSSLGDLVVKLQQLEADVRRLNGVVEEQAAQLRRLEEQSLERYVDIDRRLAGGAVAGPAVTTTGATATVTAKPSVGTAPGAGPVAQPGEQAAYQSAYDLVRNRRFDDAVAAFTAFLADYPFGRFSPNAHYWLGELYLVQTPPDPELARQSFKLLLDQYPADPKVPDALYKLGRVHFLKGNRDRAREYLDRVIAEYSAQNHPAAQLARDFISENF